MDQSTFDTGVSCIFLSSENNANVDIKIKYFNSKQILTEFLCCDCEITYYYFFSKQQISLNQCKPLLIDELENGGRHFAGKVQKDEEW